MGDEFSKLTEDFLYCRHNDLLDNDEVGQVMRVIYEAGVCDDVIAGMFAHRVSKEKYNQALNGVSSFKTPKQTKGAMKLKRSFPMCSPTDL